MNIDKAELERRARFLSWSEKMAAIDVENDFALLQCFSYSGFNHGVLRNALRKDKAEALRLWLINIRKNHRFANGVQPPDGMLFGPEGELLPDTPENRKSVEGLVSYWVEEEAYRLVPGISHSTREWKEYLASQSSGYLF